MTHNFKRKVALAGILGFIMTGSGSAMQTVATGRLMREKLAHAQRVLEALTTSDYALLERESAELVRATKQPEWMYLRTPEYRAQSDAFVKAAENLMAAAKQRDLDLAATNYLALATSCYQCHRYMKNQRLAK